VRRFAVVAAVIAWAALALRLCMDIYWSVAQGIGVPYGLAKFFTAFTTLANILVGGILTASAMRTESKLCRFLRQPSVMGCAATYISVMAGVFVLLLAPHATSVGINRVAGGFLHGVTPALYLSYWLFFAPKRRLRTRHAFGWTVWAAAYFVLILIRGAVTGVYPYPFVDVGKLGYPRVTLNATILYGVFVVVGLLFVAIDQWAPWDTSAGHEGR